MRLETTEVAFDADKALYSRCGCYIFDGPRLHRFGNAGAARCLTANARTPPVVKASTPQMKISQFADQVAVMCGKSR